MNYPTAKAEIINIQESGGQGVDSFMEKYEKIVDMVLEKFQGRFDEETMIELRHEGIVGFFEALLNFERNKCKDDNSLYFYLFKSIYGYILSYLSKNQEIDEDHRFISYEDIEDKFSDSAEDWCYAKELAKEIIGTLKTKEILILENALKGLDMVEIAEEIGVTKSRVGQIMFSVKWKAMKKLEILEGRDMGHLMYDEGRALRILKRNFPETN